MHEFALQEPEPLKRHPAVAGQAPVFDHRAQPQVAGNMALQRRAQDGATTSGSLAAPLVHDVLRSPGQPLEASTRSFMEPRFGRDLSQVRVHTDERAAQSAQTVQARAYTVGQDIAFGAGQYSPHTKQGEQLIAHELAHTIQQSEASPVPQSQLNVSSPHESSERQADAAAAQISAGGPATAQSGSPAQVARETEEKSGREPGIVERAKTYVYEQLVSSLRGPQQRLILQARRDAVRLPPELRARIESDIDAFEFITDILISLVEAIVAVVGGLVSGVIGLITGLFHMVYGILHGLYLLLSGIVTGDFGPLWQWAKEVGQILLNIPSALKALITSWLEEFKHASTDRQTIMIGELTGQIIAILLPALVTGGGAAGSAAGEIGGGTGEIVGGVSRVTSTGVRLVSVSSKAETVANIAATASRASAPAAILPTQGALAVVAKQVPTILPEVAPVVAPSVAPAATQVAGTGSQLGTLAKVATVTAATAQAVKEGEKKQEQKRCGDPDLPWTRASWNGADRGEHMTAEPLTRCGPQGSDPIIDLPGWGCIENAQKPPDGRRESDFWVHAHLLHGRFYGPDLHGPGSDPRNLILTDKSINIRMYLDVERLAIARAHWLDQTLSYTVEPHHMAQSGDKRYFADGMRITLKQIDPLTRQALAILYDGTVTSSKKRIPPTNCT